MGRLLCTLGLHRFGGWWGYTRHRPTHLACNRKCGYMKKMKWKH
jgi:hypothetical protein